MDNKQKETYLRANQLYKQGKVAEALKLWLSLGQNKTKTGQDQQPIVWRLVHSSTLAHIQFTTFAFYISIFIISIFFGRIASFLLLVTGDLLHFKNYSALYEHLLDLSQSEICLFRSLPIADYGNFHLVEMIHCIQNYLSLKIIYVQNLLIPNNHFLSDQKPLHELLFNDSFLPALLLVTLGLIVDGILCFKVLQIVFFWLIKIYKSQELQLRLLLTFSMFVLCLGFYVITYKNFAIKHTENQNGWLSLIESSKSSDEESSNGATSEESNESEKDFIKNIQEQLMSKPLSFDERKAIMRMIEDYKKLLRKYELKGNGKSISANEIIEKLRNGNMKDIEKEIQKQKAMQDYETLRNEYGADPNKLSREDKEFSEILRKSFKSGNKEVLEEFMKTNKEFEELYGKENSDKVFKNKREELLKEFAKDPQKAREDIREEMRQMADDQLNTGSSLMQRVEENIETRIHAIVNYLETGGDIKIFNQMRMKFLKDFEDPKIRLAFALRIDFVIASWNEHENKYFWQMNRALMMEMVDMITEAAKANNIDVRRTHLGWFYLVSGYYQRAREECLKSIEYAEQVGEDDVEGSSVNRSNAALAVLMLQDGKTAYIEYRAIYQKLMSYGNSFSRKREELFTEYIREITASLASETPCKEGYLCRSLFLEEVNDELALDDLLKYISLRPSDPLLEKEARLKASLIKDRIANRKNK